MNPDRIQHILGNASGKRMLVIGDVMLDEFVWGKVSRISPEAPVPVVEVASESCYPGGAANVARNLVEFTKHVRVLGLVGEDSHGERLRTILAEEGISTECLIATREHPTIVKTRIIARQQQVVRVDRECRVAPGAETMERILATVRSALPETDAIIMEDYGKGMITQSLKDAIFALAAEAGVPVCVDPNPNNPLNWSGAAVVKPNRNEAFAAAGVPASEPTDDPLTDTRLLEVGRALTEKWQARNLLVTLGEHGMLLLEAGAEPYHTPTRAQEVFDVSGAGDTVIAVYALALATGATAREAAELANHAAGVVVGKLGTATVTPAELAGSF